MPASADATADTTADSTVGTERSWQHGDALVPHKPEYSDVSFLSDAEMAERRQRR